MTLQFCCLKTVFLTRAFINITVRRTVKRTVKYLLGGVLYLGRVGVSRGYRGQFYTLKGTVLYSKGDSFIH